MRVALGGAGGVSLLVVFCFFVCFCEGFLCSSLDIWIHPLTSFIRTEEEKVYHSILTAVPLWSYIDSSQGTSGDLLTLMPLQTREKQMLFFFKQPFSSKL